MRAAGRLAARPRFCTASQLNLRTLVLTLCCSETADDGGGDAAEAAAPDAEGPEAGGMRAAGRLAAVHTVTAEEAEAGSYDIEDVVLPLPGARVRYPEHDTAQVGAARNSWTMGGCQWPAIILVDGHQVQHVHVDSSCPAVHKAAGLLGEFQKGVCLRGRCKPCRTAPTACPFIP